MSEYTKEQEAEALKAAQDGLDGRKLPVAQEAIRIVLAMAKRTAEAEARVAEAGVAASLMVDARVKIIERIADERDALKARVAELERIATDYREERDIAERKLSAPKELPAQPVVVTREMVEALREFVSLHALWGMGPNGDDLTKPVNAAARAVVAMNAALEVTP